MEGFGLASASFISVHSFELNDFLASRGVTIRIVLLYVNILVSQHRYCTQGFSRIVARVENGRYLLYAKETYVRHFFHVFHSKIQTGRSTVLHSACRYCHRRMRHHCPRFQRFPSFVPPRGVLGSRPRM